MSAAATRPREAVARVGAAAVASVTIVAGLLIKAATGELGTPLPPFLINWAPRADPLAIATVAVLGASVLVAPRLLTMVRRPAAFAASVYVLALALALSLNVAHDGTRGWWSVFATGPGGSRESAYEYLPGLSQLAHGVGYYIGHFAALMPHLPLHVQGNPPGPLVALRLLDISTPKAFAALCIALGGLTAPLAYDLGRTVGDEQRGRLAAVLTAFAPSLMLFGVTSVDYAFASIGICTACLLARQHRFALLGGCALAAVASFFSWLLLAIPAWATLLAWRRDGPRSAIVCASACATAITVFYAALAVTVGYDPFAVLRATSAIYRHVSTARPYGYWILGSPVAFAVMLGLPTAWFALRGLMQSDPAAVALGAVVVLSAGLGFTKAETERIWLPFVPFACVAAAGTISARDIRRTVAVLALQALAVELLFTTIW